MHYFIPSLTHDHEDDGANDHENGLDKVCPDDCRKAASDAKESGQDQQDQDGQVEPRGPGEPHRVFDEKGAGVKVSLVRDHCTM